jgi:2-amino-4-hydroxy-6-hydroxymethyldihydropteridine diphosphokinase
VIRAVVGLGASIGSRRRTLQLAVEAIRAHPKARCVRLSRIYESPPLGTAAKGVFLNGAVLCDWQEDSLALLHFLKQLERRFGRQQSARWGDRVLDADILWVEGLQLKTRLLEIPHPGLLKRNFALWPLLDVLPEAVERHGVTTRQQLAKMRPPAAIGVLAG